jgi:pimeloyl-ACP methyl ester carboxylesterase
MRDGTLYAYDHEGDSPAHLLIVFGHGALAGREMFRAQVAALDDRYRCVSLEPRRVGPAGAVA